MDLTFLQKVNMMKNDDMLMAGGYDAVTIVCFLNGALDHKMNYKGEPVNLMEQFMEMCQVLRQHTFRPFLILGGSADLWKMDDKWNFWLRSTAREPSSLGSPYPTGLPLTRN